tara:strand:- start:277 stop:603 length:327 start_codon:yes stop_codon:yes gene_type:complete
MKTKEFYGHTAQTEPSRVNQVLTFIRHFPGIDAPGVCKHITEAQIGIPTTEWESTDLENQRKLSGPELANYLGEWWGGTWNEVCEAVDHLLEEGRITFSDDGELNCVE